MTELFNEEGLEVLDGHLSVPVTLTVKQYRWLKELADDLRCNDISDALAVCVNSHIEAHEKGGLNPSKYNTIKYFEQCMQSCAWREMIPVVERFQLLLQQNELKDKLRNSEEDSEQAGR